MLVAFSRCHRLRRKIAARRAAGRTGSYRDLPRVTQENPDRAGFRGHWKIKRNRAFLAVPIGFDGTADLAEKRRRVPNLHLLAGGRARDAEPLGPAESGQMRERQPGIAVTGVAFPRTFPGIPYRFDRDR